MVLGRIVSGSHCGDAEKTETRLVGAIGSLSSLFTAFIGRITRKYI